MTTPADLIDEHIRLDDFLKAEAKRFDEFCRPTRDRLNEIHQQLLGMLIEQKTNAFRTDFGTASKSVIVTPKIEDRDAYLKFIGDNWSKYGNEMLQLSAPQKDAVKTWMEDNAGQLPPGVVTSSFVRVNIRRG